MTQATKFAVDPGWRILLKDLGVSEDEVLRRARLPLDLLLPNKIKSLIIAEPQARFDARRCRCPA